MRARELQRRGLFRSHRASLHPFLILGLVLATAPWGFAGAIPESLPTYAGGSEGTGWVVAHIQGSGNAVLQIEGERASGLGILAGTIVKGDGEGKNFSFNFVTDSWYHTHVHTNTTFGPVGVTWPMSGTGNFIDVYELGLRNFTGDMTLIGIAAGGFERWRWSLVADHTFEVLSVRWSSDPPLLATLDEFQGTFVATAAAAAVGAHAAVGMSTRASFEGRFLGAFVKPFALVADGVDFLEVEEPDGSVRACPCHWTDLAGAKGGPGDYEFRATGAAARAIFGETVFVLAVDLPADAWAPAP